MLLLRKIPAWGGGPQGAVREAGRPGGKLEEGPGSGNVGVNWQEMLSRHLAVFAGHLWVPEWGPSGDWIGLACIAREIWGLHR